MNVSSFSGGNLFLRRGPKGYLHCWRHVSNASYIRNLRSDVLKVGGKTYNYVYTFCWHSSILSKGFCGLLRCDTEGSPGGTHSAVSQLVRDFIDMIMNGEASLFL